MAVNNSYINTKVSEKIQCYYDEQTETQEM